MLVFPRPILRSQAWPRAGIVLLAVLSSCTAARTVGGPPSLAAPPATVVPTSSSSPPAPTPSSSPPAPAQTPMGAVASPPVVAPASSPASVSSLAGRVVVIDPGHNGQNWAHVAEINRLVSIGNGAKACDTTGTATNDGYTEAGYTFDLATRLAALLSAGGARVILTRPDNNGWGPCIDQRAAIGNNAHADVALSIHADGSVTGRGFHVIYPAPVPGFNDGIVAPSTRLALDVRDAYRSGTGMPYATYIGHSGLDQRSDLGGLNLSRVPKVFIETGNMRDATDAAQLESPTFRQGAAEALASGIRAFLAGS